jgi:hypothetical protein
MPSKSLTRNRPLVYPDWSTLVYAFAGTAASAPQECKDLAQTVSSIAAGANLCLSLIHIYELVHKEKPDERLAMAQWLESLDTVWFDSDGAVEISEMRHAVVDAVNGTRTPPPVPARSSFLSIWGPALTGEALEYALKHPTIPALAETVAGEPRLMKRLEEGMRGGSVDAARRLYRDRVEAFKEVGEKAVNVELDRRFRVRLNAEALQATAGLRSDPASGFHVTRTGIFVAPTDEEVTRALNGFPDLSVLPYFFLSQRFLRCMAKEVSVRPSVDSKAFDEQRGDYYDIFHLVGAAYCDVFTCDQRTASRLAGGCALVGRPSPITAAGGIGALNGRILRQLEAPSLVSRPPGPVRSVMQASRGRTTRRGSC